MENKGAKVVKESKTCISLNLAECNEYNAFKESIKKYKEFLYEQATENLLKLNDDLTNIHTQIKLNCLYNIQKTILSEFDQDIHEFPFAFTVNNFNRWLNINENNVEGPKVLLFYLLSNSLHSMANLIELYMEKVSNDSKVKILSEFLVKFYEEFNNIYNDYFHQDDKEKESPK